MFSFYYFLFIAYKKKCIMMFNLHNRGFQYLYKVTVYITNGSYSVSTKDAY